MLRPYAKPEHHTVLIVGGGPAGLALAVVLGGWHPFYRESALFESRHPQLAAYLRRHPGSLLALDFPALVRTGVSPVDLFRLLHHPSQRFQGLDQIGLDFRPAEPLDYLLLSREPAGGLWNNVPANLLTLSPGHWMELAFYPLAQYAAETDRPFDMNALICKRDLIDYYHRIPERFGQTTRMRTDEEVIRIEPDAKGFLVTSRQMQTGEERRYTSRSLLYAVGQRCILRRLNVPGEDLPFVTNQYDRPEDFPGERVAVIGGGRSSDWAATELYDAGKQVSYVMRQNEEHHWRLISDSRDGLPYYARMADIIESRDRRFETLYGSHVRQIDGGTTGGRVLVSHNGHARTLDVDHVVIEIGGIVDYSPFQGFPPLQLVEKYDNYRFQCHQMRVHPHNYESIDIPNLYPGGYLAEGMGLVVIAMHGTTYAIAGDILRKEGCLR
ncbi:MAG: NAD(P)-binding domain-containing protein [Candidatus Latescibacteria bacterium]|nr:NAD(P)-binding domain-containing protein [Candidatus Latescibacterota bacterium]